MRQVAVIYRKADGTIMRVSNLPLKLVGKIMEEDIHLFLRGIDDLSAFAMVFVKERQYLDIERYRVETDVDGNFIDIVEKADILSSFDEEKEINVGLLDRDADIVISVLGIIDDKERLARYKTAEESGQRRSDVMNFFRERGV